MKDTLGRENRKLEDRNCPQCGVIFRPVRSGSKYCSRKCMWANNGGHNKKAESWWKNSRGYIEGRVWVGETQRRVKKHRWVMEQHLGYAINPRDDVHHLNGNKEDNRIENLELICHSEHTKKSNEEREYKNGYKLNISDEERKARSERMRNMPRKNGHVAGYQHRAS